MATKEERDDFWKWVAIAAVCICGVSCFVTFCEVTGAAYREGRLQMYEKLCPIEQLKEADNGGKN